MVLKYLLVAALVTIAGCSHFKNSSSSSQSASAGSTTAPQPQRMEKPNWMKAEANQPFAKTPPMDSTRKVNEQDCASGGVDLTAGNLRCRR